MQEIVNELDLEDPGLLLIHRLFEEHKMDQDYYYREEKPIHKYTLDEYSLMLWKFPDLLKNLQSKLKSKQKDLLETQKERDKLKKL